MGWLDETTIALTGGGSGLGRALVDRFLAEGARVAVLELSEAKCDELADIEGVEVVQGDATDYQANVRVVEVAEQTFGSLDVFVGNAGVWDYGTPLDRLDPEALPQAFDEVFKLNVLGYLLGARASIEALRRTNGSMIFTVSNAGFWPSGGGPLYTGSKHAVMGLIKQLAYELAPDVRVNGVAPGAMPSDLRGPASLGLDQTAIDSLPMDRIVERFTALERPISPEDYTGHYVLLASRENSLTVTGSVHNCDGGVGVRGRKLMEKRD